MRNLADPFSCLTFFDGLFKIGYQIIRLFEPDGHTGVADRNPPIRFFLACHDTRIGIPEAGRIENQPDMIPQRLMHAIVFPFNPQHTTKTSG